MRFRRCLQCTAPGLLAAGAIAAGLGTGVSLGAAKPLPPGCNLGYGGQTFGVAGGHATTFHFEGYNAVPPGHRAKAARIYWGDRTSTKASAATKSKPVSKGCFVTTFTARHTYPVPPACKRTPCSRSYNVTLRYRDAQTNAKHTMGALHVNVVRPAAQPRR